MDLSPDQLLYLKHVLAYFREHTTWPMLKEVQRSLSRETQRPIDIVSLVSALPRELAPYSAHLGNPAILNVRALYLCEATEEINDFLAVLRLAVDKYFGESDDQSLTGVEVQEALALDAERMARVYEILNVEPGILGSGSGGNAPTEWRREVSDQIIHFKEVLTIEDYLDMRDHLLRPLQETEASQPAPLLLHVQVSSGLFKSSHAFNLTPDEVYSRFVDPWERGTEIVAGGKVFDPQKGELHILEAPYLPPEEELLGAGWLKLMTIGREVTDSFIHSSPGSLSTPAREPLSGDEVDPRDVVVVYGRDKDARNVTFDFLRALGLRPQEWTHLVQATGSGSPYTGEVVERAFPRVQAVIVLFTPDDEVRLHSDLRSRPEEEQLFSMQPRPNVLLETGMALATHPEKTIIVEIGEVRGLSDLAGRHTVRLDGTPEPLNDLANRLRTAGCEVDTSGGDWMRLERFAGLSTRGRMPGASKRS